MTRSSRFLLPFALIALAASLAVGVPRGAATDPFPNVGIATLSSEHFTIHYNRDDHSTDCPTMFITQELAGDTLGMAERAFALYTSWGYSAPILDAGGGLLDISVDQFSATPNGCISYGLIDPSIPREVDGTLSRWDALINPVPPLGAGEIHLDSVKGLSYHTIAHEVFHLFQRSITTSADPWVAEGTAEWAAVKAESAAGGLESNPDRTLDCVGSECGDTEFDKNGYPGWMLFEYLTEHYGDAKIKEILSAAPMTGTQALTDPAPDLTVYAPELLRVSAKTRVLRFVVFSSGTGALRAVLGSSWPGATAAIPGRATSPG